MILLSTLQALIWNEGEVSNRGKKGTLGFISPQEKKKYFEF